MKLMNLKRAGNVYYPFFLFLLFGLMSCRPQLKKNLVQWQGEAFGTTYHISMVSDSALVITQAQVDSVLNEVNAVFSTYLPNTYINHFNKNTLLQYYEQDHRVYERQRREFFPIFHLSKKINSISDGAFDPSAGPLFNLWGFAENKKHQFPTQDQIDSIISYVGMHQFLLSCIEIVKSDERATLNFNAIAKGHGADRVAQYMEFKGVSDYMVEIGGEVRCKGFNAKNKDWTIGINRPNEGSAAYSIYGVVSIQNKALATSGNYRNFYRDSLGNVIGHTINPKTGRPVISDILSASVLAPTCAEADAYATAFMVLGKEKSMKVLNKDSSLAAVFIYKENGVLQDTAVGKINFLK